MKNILARGGIEIIAVFIGISGGLWSEKQIELKKTLKAEKTADKIMDKDIDDGTVSDIKNVAEANSEDVPEKTVSDSVNVDEAEELNEIKT